MLKPIDNTEYRFHGGCFLFFNLIAFFNDNKLTGKLKRMFQEKKMETIAEKRCNPRIDTANIVEYALYDEKKIKIGHGKACTINLSQTGTLLQTKNKIEGAFIILMAIDLDGKKIKVNGKVITSRVCSKTGYYLTGIKFVGPKDKQIEAVIAFVKAYQRKKYRDETRLDDLH